MFMVIINFVFQLFSLFGVKRAINLVQARVEDGYAQKMDVDVKYIARTYTFD